MPRSITALSSDRNTDPTIAVEGLVLQFHSQDSGRRLTWLQVALVGVVIAGGSEAAFAANHTIPSKSSTFECHSVKPGDTLTIPSGPRGPLRIRNCSGTQSNPIVIRNDADGSGPAVISRSSTGSGGFVLNCENCTGIVIDGSQKWRGAPSGKTYGIKLTVSKSSSPSAFLRIGGLSRFITIRGIEIDGAWPRLAKNGSGTRINDLEVRRSAHPNLWREGILIEDNYVHDVALEGMYVGANYSDGDLPVRNVEIRNNRLEDIGFDGINTKSMWSGDNRIHHNVIRRAGKNSGKSSNSAQYSGIKNNAGTVKIYNNWIESTGQHGIQSWTHQGPRESEGKGPFEAEIWNNVIVGAGELWRSFMGDSFGISVGAQSGKEKPVPQIYNNTIVNSRQSAIKVTAQVKAGFVRDNIAAGTARNPVISAPSHVDLLNNRIGSVSQMGFVDPGRGNFRLQVGSPARNEATNGFPPTDHGDVPRPKEGAADQGAFEGSGS
jgi:hypothetical protein